MDCSNCGLVASGVERSLVLEGTREIAIALCDPCHEALLEVDWIDAGEARLRMD